MEWTKENLAKIYFEKFGIDFTPEELDFQWNLREETTITPEGNLMNIAVTPLWIKTCVEKQLERTGLTLDDKRFKKLREEVIPAMDYALFLKKIGYGEHFICSSDSPDIVLYSKEKNLALGKTNKKWAVPLEVTFINNFSVKDIVGADSAEKIVAVIEKNKLNKRYDPHTTLLAVVDMDSYNLDLEKVVSLLKEKVKNFKSVELWITEDSDNCVVACVYPKLATHSFNIKRDLEPLMY